MRTTLPEPIEIFERAWRDFSEHLGTLVASVFIMGGLFFALYLVLIVVVVGAVFALRGDQLLFQIVNNAFTGLFGVAILWGYIGMLRFTLEVARGQEPQLGTLFKQTRLLPNYFLTNSVVQLLVILACLPIVGLMAIPVWVLWDSSATSIQANLPAIGVGAGLVIALVVALVPISAASTVSIYFAVDHEVDPMACITAGLRAVRPHIGWTYKFVLLAIVIGLAMGVVAMTCIGVLVVVPFSMLVTNHYYLVFAKVVEAQLVADAEAAAAASVAPSGDAAEAAPGALVEAVEAAPSGELIGGGEPEGAALGDPVGPASAEPKPEAKPKNPYLPPDAPVYQRPDRSLDPEIPGDPKAAPLPPGAHRFKPKPAGPITAMAVVCLLPWIFGGGNPGSGIVVGFLLARRFGFPDYLGAVAGVGVLMLCGVAALVVLLVGRRGRREVIVDDAGFALDGNKRWTGQRLAWAEIRGFRISGRGVELFPHGLLGWVWRPVVPTQERDTHDLVEKLEARGVMRV